MASRDEPAPNPEAGPSYSPTIQFVAGSSGTASIGSEPHADATAPARLLEDLGQQLQRGELSPAGFNARCRELSPLHSLKLTPLLTPLRGSDQPNLNNKPTKEMVEATESTSTKASTTDD